MICGGGGRIILAEGFHHWGRRAMLLLNDTLAFSLQLMKSPENIALDSALCTDSAPCWGGGPPGPLIVTPAPSNVADFRQTLLSTRAEATGSPRHLTQHIYSTFEFIFTFFIFYIIYPFFSSLCRYLVSFILYDFQPQVKVPLADCK